MPTTSAAPRVGARVLLLDPDDRVLLIHARDPDDPAHHWWETPGGGQDNNEPLPDTARRELAEETGLAAVELDRKLWVRESRFWYRGRDHHRVDHVFLARVTSTAPQVALRPTDNERVGLIERRWWSAKDLHRCKDKLLPHNLPELVTDLLSGRLGAEPLILTS